VKPRAGIVAGMNLRPLQYAIAAAIAFAAADSAWVARLAPWGL
jgi:hypothetical protein